MIEFIYSQFVNILDKILWYSDRGTGVHRIFLAPNIGNFRVSLGRIRAVRTFRRASKTVPAYKHFLSQQSYEGPVVGFRSASLGDIPEMDKTSYIKAYPLPDKLYYGRLPERGVMFDESSGSSGKPTSWVRGPRERRITQRVMQVSFHEYIEDRKPIVINTFSMGAWATGLNTTLCLVGIARVKSTGPDITKVIDTLLELGPTFDYVITGYPPFLKQVADSPEIDWKRYRIAGIYGGEGISEAMRAELLHTYTDIIGSYGASDLEINIAHESKFTIGLRKALNEDTKLREVLLQQNRGIVPMVFQYNPFDYLIETNDKGELLVTICRTENISPRIRYNIHDLGHAEDFYSIIDTLKQNGHSDLVDLAELDFGVLFHYGRSDLSVDYNGAVVGPEEVKQIINADATFAKQVQNFRLISYEDQKAHKHLMITVELRPDVKLKTFKDQALLTHIVEQLKVMNLDFKSAISTSPIKPEIKVYGSGQGIFDPKHQKLKNDYVWNIDYKRAKEEAII